MNRLLVALAFAAAVPSVAGFGGITPGCDGYYDGTSCPAPNGKWPLISDSPPCHYYFTCVDGEINEWFVGCGDETPFFDPDTLECVEYTGQECLCVGPAN